jgi:hypothetical protein
MADSLTMVRAGVAGVSVAGIAAGAASAVARREPNFVRRAHLARDDWALDPLARPMRTGVASFELGVWLDDEDRVQVGSNRWDRDAGNAIGPRVLARLADRAALHGGRMFPRQRGSITLMLEIAETDPARQLRTYEVLDTALREHASILTRFQDGAVIPGPVTVILTGEGAPRQVLAAQTDRLAFIDGTFSDVGAWGAPANLVPMLSEDWNWRFGWDGHETFPAAERQLLREIVATAHSDGRRVRFYGLPQRWGRPRARIWRELISSGVDLITLSKDVRPLARYLRKHSSVRDTVTIAPQVRNDRAYESSGHSAGAVGARR